MAYHEIQIINNLQPPSLRTCANVCVFASIFKRFVFVWSVFVFVYLAAKQGMQITACSRPLYALIWTFWIPLPTLRHTRTFRHLASTFSVQNQKLCAHEIQMSRFKRQLAFPNFVVAKLVSTWNLYPLKLVTTGTPVSSHLQLDFPAFGQNLRCNLSKLPFEFLLRLIYQVCWIYHLRN